MSIQDRTLSLVHRITTYNSLREHVFNGSFLYDLIRAKLPSISDEDLFEIQVSIQQKLLELEDEEALIKADSEEIKSEVAKEVVKASEEGRDYPSYAGWKTSVRRSYTYNEQAILEVARKEGVSEESLYKVTKKFDPSKLLKTGVSEELKDAIASNKSVSKYTATVKWDS
ncbi:MAG: hypothetical protein VXZ72_01505 [Chlamydiota bacterium]|nr:hypothetical protein [Chlamydiota bacterium]